MSEVRKIQRVGRTRRRRWLSRLAPVTFALVAAGVTAAYCWLLAPTMYMSEARFAVRGAEGAGLPTGGRGGLGGGLGGIAGGMAAVLDGYVMRDFVQSQDAVSSLENKLGFVERMVGRTADPLVRLPNNPTTEQMLAFYQRNVVIRFSLTEQILTLNVYAFTPKDARELAAGLLELTEDFANKTNERSRADAVKYSEAEVGKAEDRMVQARLAINKWRLLNGNIDPSQSVSMTQALIAKLNEALTQTRASLADVEVHLDPQSARRRQIDRSIKSIEEQIDMQRKSLTGGERPVAQLLLEYERLIIEQEFATKQLESARVSLEQARVAANRQQKYLTIVTQPSQPQDPAFPQTFRYVATVLIVAPLAYLIFSLIFGIVRDTHA